MISKRTFSLGATKFKASCSVCSGNNEKASEAAVFVFLASFMWGQSLAVESTDIGYCKLVWQLIDTWNDSKPMNSTDLIQMSSQSLVATKGDELSSREAAICRLRGFGTHLAEKLSHPSLHSGKLSDWQRAYSTKIYL